MKKNTKKRIMRVVTVICAMIVFIMATWYLASAVKYALLNARLSNIAEEGNAPAYLSSNGWVTGWQADSASGELARKYESATDKLSSYIAGNQVAKFLASTGGYAVGNFARWSLTLAAVVAWVYTARIAAPEVLPRVYSGSVSLLKAINRTRRTVHRYRRRRQHDKSRTHNEKGGVA